MVTKMEMPIDMIREIAKKDYIVYMKLCMADKRIAKDERLKEEMEKKYTETKEEYKTGYEKNSRGEWRMVTYKDDKTIKKKTKGGEYEKEEYWREIRGERDKIYEKIWWNGIIKIREIIWGGKIIEFYFERKKGEEYEAKIDENNKIYVYEGKRVKRVETNEENYKKYIGDKTRWIK